MDLSSTGIAKIAIYSVTFAASYDFWRNFAGKGVLNVLGGVLLDVLELWILASFYHLYFC